MALNEKDVTNFSYQACLLKVTESCNFILLSCSADIQFGGRPKPENLGDHVFYETHQKFSISVLICDMLHIYTLHVRIQFNAGYEIHLCIMNSHLHCSERNFFIYLHQTTVLHGLLCLQ